MIWNNNKINKEYLYYLMNDLGLLNDYALEEIGISFDDYDNPTDEAIEKIETYIDKQSKNN